MIMIHPIFFNIGKMEFEYIFAELQEEVDELALYLKAREADGAMSVHFYFPNELDAAPQISNHIAVKLSGFSEGFGNFQRSCTSAQ